MQYLLKLRTTSATLATEVKRALEDEYKLAVEVTELGKLEHDDYKLVWLEVQDSNGECTKLVATGYDGDSLLCPKYRIFGHVEKFCPSCNIFRSLDTPVEFCSECGHRYLYKM